MATIISLPSQTICTLEANNLNMTFHISKGSSLECLTVTTLAFNDAGKASDHP